MTLAEYIARTVATAAVYEALGLDEITDRTRWSLLSFARATPSNPD